MTNMKFMPLILAACAVVALAAQGKKTSPVVHSDNTVTFSFMHSGNDAVYLRGSVVPRKNWLKTEAGALGKEGKVKMTRNGDVWTYTTPVLPSEFYTYCFEVDGERFPDPCNPHVVRDIEDSLSYFIIPGGIADDYAEHSVSHGDVRKVWYPSSLAGMSRRRMTFYLPPQYAASRQKRFPVLYLLHGSGGDENSWGDCGRAFQILDNLIAEGRCRPMIVVMPNGNVNLAAAPGEDPTNPDVKPSANNTRSMLGKIESVFMSDIVDYVDSHFRTIADRGHRAIAGLSLGGLHTLFIALNNPDEFDYIGLFSAQTTNALNDGRISGMQKVGSAWKGLKSHLPFIGGGRVDRKISNLTSEELSVYEDVDSKLKRLYSPTPKLFYVAVGKDDFVKKLNDDLRKKLDFGNLKYTYNETGGGHTWENWRKYLVDFLPRLFN